MIFAIINPQQYIVPEYAEDFVEMVEIKSDQKLRKYKPSLSSIKPTIFDMSKLSPMYYKDSKNVYKNVVNSTLTNEKNNFSEIDNTKSKIHPKLLQKKSQTNIPNLEKDDILNKMPQNDIKYTQSPLTTTTSIEEPKSPLNTTTSIDKPKMDPIKKPDIMKPQSDPRIPNHDNKESNSMSMNLNDKRPISFIDIKNKAMPLLEDIKEYIIDQIGPYIKKYMNL